MSPKGHAGGIDKPNSASNLASSPRDKKKEKRTMRTLIATLVALGLAAAPALAGDAPKTKADCEKAGMKWDDASQSCSKG